MIDGDKIKLLSRWFLVLILTGCSTVPLEQEVRYSKIAREHLYKMEQWSFDGRLSLTGKNDSWSASINWWHRTKEEKIKLSGPLGQGATIIKLSGSSVTIDRGDGKQQTSEHPEEFVNQQLGMFVPVRSLRFWVIGMPEPTTAFVETVSGFSQGGWLIEYKQMQSTDNQSMPRKIFVTNGEVKLKLIIDQWDLNDAKAI
jgi:outer membrane lipoprotein LolB